MNREYLPSFIKDLKKPKKTPIYLEIRKLAFQTIPNCQNITDFKNIKKIRGHKKLTVLELEIIVLVFLLIMRQ